MRASRGERVCSRFLARLDGVAHLGGEVLWNQSFGSAGEGWDGPLRATHSRRAFPRWHQPLRTRVLLEDPAHVPGTNSGFRVHVLQTWLGLGLGLGIGLSKDLSSSSGVVQAWWRAPRLGPSHPPRRAKTAHRAARSAPMAWALRARAPAAARPRRVASWVGCHAFAKRPGVITRFEPPESANCMVVNQRMLEKANQQQ